MMAHLLLGFEVGTIAITPLLLAIITAFTKIVSLSVSINFIKFDNMYF